MKYLGHLLALLSIVLLVDIFLDNVSNINHIKFGFENILIFTFLIVWGQTGYLLFSLAWTIQVKAKYHNFQFLTSFRIIALTQVAKYLPGNIGHYVGRYYLSKDLINKQDFAYTLLVENILFALSSLIIGLIYLYYFDIFTFINLKSLTTFGLIAFLFMIIVFLFIKRARKKIDILKNDKVTLAKVFLIFLSLPFLGGLTIYILIPVVKADANIPYLLCVSGFALSFLLGFIVPGAPGGIGVREYAFTMLLGPFIGNIFALEVILIVRLLSIISDILLFFSGKLIDSKQTVLYKNE